MVSYRKLFAAFVILLSSSVQTVRAQNSVPVPAPPSALPALSPVPVQTYTTQGLNGAFFSYASPSSGGTITYWGGGPNASLMDFLAADHIQKQIELSKEQKETFRDFHKQLAQEYSNIRNKYPELKKKDLDPKERQKINRTVHLKYMEVKKELNKELEDSLVPQQLELVKSLKFRQSVQVYGLTWTLVNGQFKDEVKITDKQKKEMEKNKRETEAAVHKKIAEMRKEGQEKILKVLDRKQRELIKELEGKQDPKKAKPPVRL